MTTADAPDTITSAPRSESTIPPIMPDTPPELSSSRSSKTSSFRSSYHSDADSFIADSANFEDIGLDDETALDPRSLEARKSPNPYSLSSEVRMPPRRPSGFQSSRAQRDLTVPRSKPAYPTLRGQIRNPTAEGLGIVPHAGGLMKRGVTSPISSHTARLPQARRNRSISPCVSPNQLAAPSSKPRRESWQGRDRKTARELEQECEDDDGDDVPDECMLENVPMSPRPPEERSRPASTATSPERPAPKDRVRSIGNGTSPIPAEQGELRSPRLGVHRGTSMGQFPIHHNALKPRAKSWTDALSELSDEAKALTEALEAHADEDPGANTARAFAEKGRVKSAFAELPPLRRTDIMIDPLPCSKEKEAVLSRTRPSWLPPKDPAEEKRHLKEYQKMMALSAEAEKRRETEHNIKNVFRDDTANSLLRIWEEHVLPNWDEATRQKRTRELWWRGIAPRSRGVIWAKAIGNELGISETSFTAALRRAQALEKTIKHGSQLDAEEERKKAWLDRIHQDAASTYPELRIFQVEGPLHQSLLDVLKAYAMYRSDVGYIPGTNTVAALLLLNMPTPALAFLSLANLLNRSLPLSFHTSDPGAIAKTYSLTMSFLSTKAPRLYSHLTAPLLHAHPDAYLRAMYTSLFTSVLDLDCATRFWDIMVFEGDSVVVRAGVAVLIKREADLFGCENVAQVATALQNPLEVAEEEWIKVLRDVGRTTRTERGMSESTTPA